MKQSKRNQLLRWVKGFSLLALLLSAYVVVDFSFNQAERKSYSFKIPELEINQPVLLRQQALLIVVARYDRNTLDQLTPTGRLAGISQSFANQPQRVNDDGYFVALAYGTKSSCPLTLHKDYFQESCSDARYDLLGRSLNKQHYPDLDLPQYNFNTDYSLLTIE